MKYRFWRCILVATSIIFVSSGCQGDDPIDGFDLISNPNDRGIVDSTTVSGLNTEISYQDSVRKTGRAIYLDLGQLDEIETFVLLKFEVIPDTFTIHSGRIVLNTNTFYADGKNKTSFQAAMYPMAVDWDETSVTYDSLVGLAGSFQNAFDQTPISNAEVFTTVWGVGSPDSTFERVAFPLSEHGLELVRLWTDTTRTDNYGVLIRFENSSFVKEFISRNSGVQQPRIELDVSSGGTVADTTISRIGTADAFVANRTTTLPQGPLYVDNLFGYESVIKFDLSEIPRESTINRAVLHLNILPEYTNVKRTSGFTVLVVTLPDSFEVGAEPDVSASPFVTSGVVSFSSTVLNVTLTNLVQAWVTNSIQNHGVLLNANSRGTDITRVAFESAVTNPELAPRLTIEYSTTQQ